MALLGEFNGKLVPGFFWTAHYVSFSISDFNLYSFDIINHNHEYNSFSEFCESL